MSKPIVAVVGRPNVGKSTLFNALAGSRISIVKDTPGITRDRIYASVSWLKYDFTLIDTGGIEPDSKDILLSRMREQAQIAIDTADVIIFMVDVKQGLVDSDSKVADLLRRSGKPVVLAVNKVDDQKKYGNDVYEFYNLGIGDRSRAPTERGSESCLMRWYPISGILPRVQRERTFRRSRWWESPIRANPPL